MIFYSKSFTSEAFAIFEKLWNLLTRIIHEEHFPFSLPLFSSVG